MTGNFGRPPSDQSDSATSHRPVAGGGEPNTETATLHERVGGDDWFFRLVDRFYDGVETDPVLRPLYPADLAGPRERLAMFLAQYFGGPPAYNAARGLPRLRMRHGRFTIGSTERDAWLSHMAEAVRTGGLSSDDEDDVLHYFAATATMLVNAGSAELVAPPVVRRQPVPTDEVS